MSNLWLDAAQSIQVDTVFVYNQKWNNKAWIAGLVPCQEDNQSNYFYGPNILNIKIFTKLDALDFYDPETLMDDLNVKCIQDTYETFNSYVNYIILDEAIKTDTNKDDFIKFDKQLKGICEKLAKWRFIYLGQLDSRELNLPEFLTKLIGDLYQSQ